MFLGLKVTDLSIVIDRQAYLCILMSTCWGVIVLYSSSTIGAVVPKLAVVKHGKCFNFVKFCCLNFVVKHGKCLNFVNLGKHICTAQLALDPPTK